MRTNGSLDASHLRGIPDVSPVLRLAQLLIVDMPRSHNVVMSEGISPPFFHIPYKNHIFHHTKLQMYFICDIIVMMMLNRFIFSATVAIALMFNATGARAATSPEFTITTTSDTSSFNFNISAAGTFEIDWGDGEIETIVKEDTEDINYPHNFDAPGTYTIGISGQATAYNTTQTVAAISFSGNTNIVAIDGSLGAIFGTISDTEQPRFVQTFRNCTNLTSSIPPDLFTGVYGQPITDMFNATFSNCKNMTGEIPPNLFAGISGTPKSGVFGAVFMWCEKLTGEIPPDLFAGLVGPAASSMFDSAFYGCKGLTGSVPPELFRGITGPEQSYMYRGTFSGCTGLTGYIDASMFPIPRGDSSTAYFNTMYSNTFANASGMDTKCPENTYTVPPPDTSWTVAVCNPCPAGTTSPANSPDITSCSCGAGKYYSGDGCMVCDAGFYCPGYEKIPCPAESYSPPSASTCTNTSPGYYSTNCGASENIPYEYIELEYIENDGTQYIDTGVVYKNAPRVVTSVYRISTGDRDILGNLQAIDGNFIVDYSGNAGIFARYGSPTASQYTTSVGIRSWTNIDYGKQWIENGVVKIEFPDYDFSVNEQSLYLFRGRNISSLRMKTVQIYDGDTLMRNMIPAQRKIDGEIGMYDTVNDVFYTNIGTGEFIAGPQLNVTMACTSQTICPAGYYCTNGKKNVCPISGFSKSGASECTVTSTGYYSTGCENEAQIAYGYTELDYIENSGQQYIDTGVVYKIEPRIITSIYRLTTADSDIMGTNQATNGNFIVDYASSTVYARYGSSGARTYTTTIGQGEWANVEYGRQWIENGTVKVEFSAYDFSVNTKSIQLFRGRNISSLRMKTVQIYDGDTLMRNMVPARRNRDGAIGMYDTVNGKFYGNAGRGTFIAGTEIGVTAACTTQTICPAGHYCVGGVNFGECVVGTWSPDGANACTACTNAPANATYTKDKWTNTECPWVCNENHVITAINTCTAVCDAGVTKLKTDTGISVQLFKSKNTTPSINIQVNNTTCYADLISGTTTNEIHVEYDGKTYHTVK